MRHRCGPDPGAVGVERVGHVGLCARVVRVGQAAGTAQHDRRAVQVVQHPADLFLRQRLRVPRQVGLAEPHVERQPGLRGQPFGHLLTVAWEVLEFGFIRACGQPADRRLPPVGLVRAVVVEVELRRRFQRERALEPGAGFRLVHRRTQCREQLSQLRRRGQ